MTVVIFVMTSAVEERRSTGCSPEYSHAGALVGLQEYDDDQEHAQQPTAPMRQTLLHPWLISTYR
jgi:hypothetical protein